MMESMEIDVGEKWDELVKYIHDRLESLASETSVLLNELDDKNGELFEANQKYYIASQEIDVLKCEISNTSELNKIYRDELLDLRQMLEANIVDVNSEDKKSILIDKINSLIGEINRKTVEIQQNKKENLINNLEILSKLKKSDSNVLLLKGKKMVLEIIMQAKDEYNVILLNHNNSLKEKFVGIQSKLMQEIESQKVVIETTREDYRKLKSDNVECLTKLEACKEENQNLTQKLKESDRKYQELESRFDVELAQANSEKENLLAEINRLNALMENSKNQLLEQYLEKYYPNITAISQMFNGKLSLSQMYSLYVDTKKQNEDLSIEKKVVQERVQALEGELEVMRNSLDQSLKEIKSYKHWEQRMTQKESDFTQQTVLLKFYQDASHKFGTYSRNLYDHYVDVANKMRSLLSRETSEVEHNSTGVMALQYMMELQDKFAEFNQLQADFESQKVNFDSEIQNLLDSKSKVEHLTNRVELLETENRQLTSKYELLSNEFGLLQTLFDGTKNTADCKLSDMEKSKQELLDKVELLNTRNKELKTRLNEVMASSHKGHQEKTQLENKLSNQVKQNTFLNERMKLQQEQVSQLERAMMNAKKQNDNLNQINQQLENNLKLLEKKQAQSEKKVFELESKLSGCTFEIDLLKKKEKLLLDRLETTQKDANCNNDLNFILDLVQKSTSPVDQTILQQLEEIKLANSNLEKVLSQNETQWSEEKKDLEDRVVQIEQLLGQESARFLQLQNEYSKLQEFKSTLVFDKSASIDAMLKTENDLLRTQFESLKNQFDLLKEDLSKSKTLHSELLQRQTNFLSNENKLKREVNSLNFEVERIKLSEKQKCAQLEVSITKLRTDLDQSKKKLEDLIAEKELEMKCKNVDCENHMRLLESVKQRVAELETQLDSGNQSGQTSDLKESYQSLQTQYEKLQQMHSDKSELISVLHKQLEELQNRYAQSELMRIKSEEKLSAKANKLGEEYAQLSSEHQVLQKSHDQLTKMNQELCTRLSDLTRKLTHRLTNADQVAQLNSLQSVLDQLSVENRFLVDKCNLQQATEARMKQEIDMFTFKVKQLEECLDKEKQIVANLKNLSELDQKSSMDEHWAESLKEMRLQKNELERKCQQLELQVNEFQLRDNQGLDKIIAENRTEIERLNKELSQAELAREKLILEEQKRRQLENDLQNLTAKFQDLDSRFRQACTAKAEKELLLKKCQTELEQLKAKPLTKEEKEKLVQELETMKNELSSAQDTMQQLRKVARRYKSQYTDLQKELTTKTSESNEEKIKEFEEKAQSVTSENENLNSEITGLREQLQNLRSQLSEKDQKMKAIALQAKQALITKEKEKNELILTHQREISSLRASQANVPMQATTGPSRTIKTHKMAVSSTIGTVTRQQQQPSTSSFESRISSNLQPSSSNDNDNDRLQSAQITSHTTSIDENSLEGSLPTAGPYKKRLLSASKLSNSEKKQKTNEESDMVVVEDDENSKNSVITLEDDSNDGREAHEAQSHEPEASHQSNADQSEESPESAADQSGSQEGDYRASTSHLMSHSSRVEFNSSLQSESTLLSLSPVEVGIELMQPSSHQQDGSDVNSSTSREEDTSSLSITTHGFSPFINSHPGSSGISSLQVPERVSRSMLALPHNPPRLLISQPEMFSPPNSIVTPNLGAAVEEDDGIVPSTPVLLVNRFDDHSISPQVPQARFTFSASTGQSSVVASNAPNTPTISETISSLISVDDPISEEYDSHLEEQAEDSSNQTETNSSAPSSSNTQSSASQPQSPTNTRSRKLRIRGLTRR